MSLCIFKLYKDVVEFVEEEYGEDNGMDEASIREHEEVTKVKNVNTLELGRHLIDTWYFSPVLSDCTVLLHHIAIT